MARPLTYIIVLVSICLVSGCAEKAPPIHRYGTWDTMEVDKCASAWLIRRHVDSLAEFVFFPTGSLIEDAIPFDTPDAELRRSSHLSAFEITLRTYDIDDVFLDRLGDIINSLEIVSWETSRAALSAHTLAVDSLIRDIISSSETPEECLRRCYPVFDSLYVSMLESEPVP